MKRRARVRPLRNQGRRAECARRTTEQQPRRSADRRRCCPIGGTDGPNERWVFPPIANGRRLPQLDAVSRRPPRPTRTLIGSRWRHCALLFFIGSVLPQKCRTFRWFFFLIVSPWAKEDFSKLFSMKAAVSDWSWILIGSGWRHIGTSWWCESFKTPFCFFELELRWQSRFITNGRMAAGHFRLVLSTFFLFSLSLSLSLSSARFVTVRPWRNRCSDPHIYDGPQLFLLFHFQPSFLFFFGSEQGFTEFYSVSFRELESDFLLPGLLGFEWKTFFFNQFNAFEIVKILALSIWDKLVMGFTVFYRVLFYISRSTLSWEEFLRRALPSLSRW